jgi:hypothetical protein
MNELEPAPAPLFDSMHFGCFYDTWCDGTRSEQDAEIKAFPLSLHRAIGLAEQEYGINEFDPSSLADGKIHTDTYEADFMDDIPEEHYPLFVIFLDHLDNLHHQNVTYKKWKPEYRLQRTETEFADNFLLRNILGLDEPFKPIPFGRNPMIEEYWAR